MAIERVSLAGQARLCDDSDHPDQRAGRELH
jgi:hypothetical protein